jgi:hypothetical protein
MNKKTQITMFVILGLVLLILVIMFFSFMKMLKQKPIPVKKIIDELETGRLKNHVTNCMAKVGAGGLEKLGANGGVIYDFEGGRIIKDELTLGIDYLPYIDNLGQPYYVAYGLRKNTACSTVDHSISGYPYPETLVSDLNSIYFNPANPANCLYTAGLDGFFGQINLTKLCYISRQSSCESYAKGTVIGWTMQKQLEDYISKNLEYCIDFESFTRTIGANITHDPMPEVEVDIHDTDVSILVKYPITISFENQEPITQILNYQTTLNTRLESIFNYLHELLSGYEVKLLNFNMETDYMISSWKPGFEISIKRAPCTSCELPYKYDDMFELVDRESSLDGKPFIFRFAIENRRPVLDLISDRTANPLDGNLDIFLNAKDPDDTPITYYFLSYGYGRENCQGVGVPGGGPGGGPGYGSPPVPSDLERWCSRTPNLITPDPVPTLSIPISEYDVGNHPVGILAVDETGLFDYQNFDITIERSLSELPPDDVICLPSCRIFFGDWRFMPALESFPPPFNNSDSYDSALSAYCEKWCRVAANQCGSICNPIDLTNYPYDLFYAQTEDQCELCIKPLVHSGQHHAVHGCGGFAGNSCIAQMPVCLLIQAQIHDPWGDYFPEPSCYDDPFFDSMTPPAYIITQIT